VLRKILLLAAAAATVIALAAPTASASFPGANGRIAYTAGSGQIATIKPDGSGAKPITNAAGFSYLEAPMYSADGARIVFDADDGSGTDLYLMRADGSHRHAITSTPGYEWGPSWSPDGRWIVYSKSGSGTQIMAIRPDGTHKRAIGTATGEYPRYSPSGAKIVYGGDDGQIHVMRADGIHDHPITSAGSNDYPDWSPNGHWIGFTSDQGGGNDVWLMRPDGSNAHQVTSKGALGYSPVFSPDGTKIAFTDGTNVWISRLNGTHVKKIVGTASECCIGWQPK
jgi:Tol biopolymer transport system component